MRQSIKLLTSLAALTAMIGSANAQTVFIKDAKVVTNTSRGILENVNVVIEDGRVTDISRVATAPNGATEIDGSGAWVTPGLFAPLAQIGMIEVGAESSTNDTRSAEGKTSVSDLAVDGFNPQSPVIDNTRIEGITHAAVTLSAGHNVFGGIGLIANTTGEFDSVENPAAFVMVQMGSRGADIAGGNRSAAFSQLRAALDDAAAYPGRFTGSPGDGDALSRRDAAALASAARGQMPIVIMADRASDILRIIDLKSEYGGLDIIVGGAAEAWMVTDEIKASGLKIFIDPINNLPDSFDFVGSTLQNAKRLSDAGVEFAIYPASAGLTNNLRLMPQHAGNAVANGLDWDTAFKAISSVPAEWFGISDATLTSGADTVVVWDGDPLEVTASPTWMMINGDVQSMSSRQTELRDRYNPTRDETQPHKYR